ncbi:MAG TPA: PIG-L family deacetylase [Gemmatimonadaceae bacterium]|nr:PIG-L family deacetylase [Gemmatimonadaceae bacterium]
MKGEIRDSRFEIRKGTPNELRNRGSRISNLESRISAAFLVLLLATATACAAQERGAAALGQSIGGLGVSARVLVIAAHPDDEDTRLITWLGRGHHADMAYLSLTRGDGGQNLIGNELGEALGVIRTEELLAARRIDGATQFFTRAYDFGFSKSPDETFRHWPRDSILRDVVTVVRAFRPHVIVAVFSGTPRDGHGHHQVSGMLARDAFDVAGDTVRVPLRAGERPWTPLKFYRTRSYWGGEGATFRYNAGEYNALLGRSYAEIAGESRSQHKSQGFGALQRKGYVPGSVRREATRVNENTPEGQEKSIFEGIDTSWTRLKPLLANGADRARIDSVMGVVTQLQRSVDLFRPATTLQSLSRLEGLVRRIEPGRGATPDLITSLADLARKVDDAIALSLGVSVEAMAPRDVVAVRDSMPVAVTVYNRGTQPLEVVQIRLRSGDVTGTASGRARAITPDSSVVDTVRVSATRVSQPWWLMTPRKGDMFAEPVTGLPEPMASGTRAEVTLASNGMRFAVDVPVIFRFADPVRGEVARPLTAEPAITLAMERTVMLAPAGGALDRMLTVRVRSAVSQEKAVRVSLELPRGLTADSASRSVSLTGVGSSRSVDFRIRGSLPRGRHTIAAVAESDGQRFTTGFVPIEYDHIRPQKLYRQASIAVEAVDVRLPVQANIAYIQGVGDNVARSLEELGVRVTILDPAKLSSTDLAPYTAVVIGTRAYEAHPDLAVNNARLMEYTRNGGTMVVQYGQYEMQQRGIMPYPIQLGRPATRVTEEDAPVTVLRSDHPLLNAPNKIGPSDWQGWVQERSLYMPSSADSSYTPLLELHDPGEPPNENALLVARYGRGVYVYTTLAFFRQLPAGVPGAARLFANLIGARPPGAEAANGVRP